jgi:hypothetical protein
VATRPSAWEAPKASLDLHTFFFFIQQINEAYCISLSVSVRTEMTKNQTTLLRWLIIWLRQTLIVCTCVWVKEHRSVCRYYTCPHICKT